LVVTENTIDAGYLSPSNMPVSTKSGDGYFHKKR